MMARLSVQNFIRNYIYFPRHFCAFTVSSQGTRTIYKDAGVQSDGSNHDEPQRQDGVSSKTSESTKSSPNIGLPEPEDEEDAADAIAFQPDSRLLSLPAELRTMIYRAALTSSTIITIHPTTHTQPALLFTCRRIRREAAALYIQENSFIFHVINLQPIIPRYDSDHWTVQTYNGVSMHQSKCMWCTFSGRADWDNLKEWLRLFYEGKMPTLTTGAGAVGWILTIGAVFEMVTRMREGDHPRTWDEIERLLGPSQLLIEKTVPDQAGYWS